MVYSKTKSSFQASLFHFDPTPAVAQCIKLNLCIYQLIIKFCFTFRENFKFGLPGRRVITNLRNF